MADKTITVTSVLPGPTADLAIGVAGAAVTEGQLLYLDTTATPQTWKLSDANAAAPANQVNGMAMNRAAIGQKFVVNKGDDQLTPGYAIAAGETVIASATPGATGADADAVTGWTKIVLGAGTGSNKMIFRPLAAGVVP